MARASEPDATLRERVASYNESFDTANRLSGVLLVARGDEVILHEAYGFAHVGLGVRNTTHTRFCIASVTKIMTSVMFSQLAMDRVLDPDVPIAKWLPDFPRGGEITPIHLARHRAGIRHRVTSAAEESLPLTTSDIVERAARFPLISEPGGPSNYSSAGYTVLARCMELASGMSYAELLERRIFGPAGMECSDDSSPGREADGLAQSYVPGRGELWPAPKKDMSFLAGAGSVVSTAEDLLRFVRALRAGTLVVPFSALASEGRVAWTGASNGWFAFIDTYAEDELTCIWVGNSWGGCAGQLRAALPAMVRGETVTPPTLPPTIPTPPADVLAGYVGWYQSRPGATNEVRVFAGELWYADSVVLAIGEDRFWHQAMGCEMRFVRDQGGAVVAIEQTTSGGTNNWPRVSDAFASPQ